jgi:hypothetical protein
MPGMRIERIGDRKINFWDRDIRIGRGGGKVKRFAIVDAS